MDIWRKWRNPRQKPPFGARIDWSDPITIGLTSCWLFNEFVGLPYRFVETGDVSWKKDGLFFNGSSDLKYLDYADLSKIKYGAVTYIVEKLDNSANYAVMSFTDGSSYNTNAHFFRYDGNFQINLKIGDQHQQSFYTTSGDVAPGVRHVITFMVNQDGNCIFINGQQRTDLSYNAGSETTTLFWADIPGLDEFHLARLYVPNVPQYYYWLKGYIYYFLIHSRPLLDDEIEHLHHEPYSFFLVPAARIFDLAPASGGQTYFYEGNIPLSLLPSHAKEVRYYPPLGGAPIVLTPQGQVRASYQKEGSQQISLTPQADIKATYVKDGSVLMQIALAAEKQAKYFAAGEIPINLQVQGEKKALYEKSGALSFSLLPFSRVQATYAKEGSVSFSLALESDIACTFRVEGSVGFILLPQGSWTYVPATGGAVYTYEGNIPIALAPEADVKAFYKKQGGLFLSLSPTSSWQAKYRHVGELLLSLVPAGEKQASFLIEGEIQLHLVPEGVAVVIKPSGQEELFVVGIIEEDDLRAVFDGAVHGEIWPRK